MGGAWYACFSSVVPRFCLPACVLARVALRERKSADQSVPLTTDGQADPLGIEAGLGDDEEPAEGVAADIALRSHFRVNGGEPIGDLALRGWQMPNGVDFEGANTLNPNEKNLIEER